jgi:hypothetical protein
MLRSHKQFEQRKTRLTNQDTALKNSVHDLADVSATYIVLVAALLVLISLLSDADEICRIATTPLAPTGPADAPMWPAPEAETFQSSYEINYDLRRSDMI